LGFEVSADPLAASVQVQGTGGKLPRDRAQLYVGNAGTAARLLTAMVCLCSGGEFHFDGSSAMRERPMSGLLDALLAAGAAKVVYEGQPGHFPFTLYAQGFQGGEIEVDASASSQLLSALLLVAPLAEAQTTVRLKSGTVSKPFVEMTLQMMRQFGVSVDVSASAYRFKGQQRYSLEAAAYPVEPDATAASYFIVLPRVVGGELTLPGTGQIRLQGDIAFCDVAKQLGLSINRGAGDCLSVESAQSAEAAPLEFDFNAISDTFLTLAALTPLLPAPVKITGIAHTRKQETDRIKAMATELRKLGQTVTTTEDTLEVHPDRAALKRLTGHEPVQIETYEDHRVAMSFGVLGCYDLHGDGRPWLTILDPGCCAKTFPDFFEQLEALRR
jgi:3-phosphoshikimate 1-carboxyvinyltransferase